MWNENTERKIEKLKDILKELSTNDPDPVIKKFSSMLFSQPMFFSIARYVFKKRPHIEEEHLIYLVFVSLQYLTNFSYDNIKTLTDEKIKSDFKKYESDLKKLCLNHNVSTNIPERYVGLQIISSILYSKIKKPLTIVDIGCSLGMGLMALNTDFFEKHINIDAGLIEYIKMRPVFKKLIGIDIIEPDIDWVLASYLPEVKEKREKVIDTYNYLREKGSKVTVIKGDALRIEEIQGLFSGYADIVWISNTCYQIEGDIENVLRGIGWLLHDSGWWLYAYYRYGTKKKIEPQTNPYIVHAFRRDNRWDELVSNGWETFKKKGLEVLWSSHEKVREIKIGKDFTKFVEML